MDRYYIAKNPDAKIPKPIKTRTIKKIKRFCRKILLKFAVRNDGDYY